MSTATDLGAVGLAAVAIIVSLIANRRSVGANRLSSASNSLAKESNDLAKLAGDTSNEANDLACSANELAGRATEAAERALSIEEERHREERRPLFDLSFKWTDDGVGTLRIAEVRGVTSTTELYFDVETTRCSRRCCGAGR